jgi:hypothetical protein
MAELFRLATPLDPHDRTSFVEAVVAELDGRTEIDTAPAGDACDISLDRLRRHRAAKD